MNATVTPPAPPDLRGERPLTLEWRVPGDDDAQARFESLIVPEIGFLARTARAMSRSEAEAEDLAQETLVKAFRSIESFDGAYPRAWLFRIARNTAINRDRRTKEFLLADDEVLETEPGPPSDDPGTSVPEGVVDDVLIRALDDLPPAFRVVLSLVDVEGMRYQEAADLLDVPVGTIMSRLHRARASVRRALTGTHLERRARRETTT